MAKVRRVERALIDEYRELVQSGGDAVDAVNARAVHRNWRSFRT